MRKVLLCSAAALMAWGCSDGGTPARVATTITVAPSAVSLDAVGATRVVRASVADQSGNAMPGAALTWTSSSSAATVAGAGGDSAVVTAAAGGSATITATSGSAAGTGSVLVAQVATSVQKMAGDGQSAVVGAALGTPLRVVVRDRLGAPVPGVAVTFAVTAGGGTVTTASGVTGADGTASAGWTLGTSVAGGQKVLATASGVGGVEFTATALTGPAAASSAAAGNSQSAGPGVAVAVRPRVRVTDEFGNPAAGVNVQFTVSAGGGAVTGATATTAADGTAEVGSWTLGAAGTNTLTATFPGTAVPPVVFTANAGVAGQLTIATGANQAAMAGTAVPVVPAVLVRNGGGTPLAGLTVSFAVTAGGGTVANATAVTNASGIATAGSWTLGATSGPNTLRATVAGVTAAPVEFRGTGCEGGGAGYKLTLCFTTTMTATQRAVFLDAATRWATVITADLPDVTGTAQVGQCGANSPSLNFVTDDLAIFAGIENIDGPGQVLGSAGPCFIRSGSSLPTLGVMRFDLADVNNLQANGQLGSVILHEMGHVLGIGSLWNFKGFLTNPSTAGNPLDTYFNGVNGIAGFDAIGGATYTGGQKVPVENTGGAGTINGHWRESVLANELMTGYLNPGIANPLSLVTVRSLTDLGYTVNVAAADAFSLTLTLRDGPEAPGRIKLHNDVYMGPLYAVDGQGRTTRVRN